MVSNVFQRYVATCSMVRYLFYHRSSALSLVTVNFNCFIWVSPQCVTIQIRTIEHFFIWHCFLCCNVKGDFHLQDRRPLKYELRTFILLSKSWDRRATLVWENIVYIPYRIPTIKREARLMDWAFTGGLYLIPFQCYRYVEYIFIAVFGLDPACLSWWWNAIHFLRIRLRNVKKLRWHDNYVIGISFTWNNVWVRSD